MTERYDDREQMEAAMSDARDWQHVTQTPNGILSELEDLEGALRAMDMVVFAEEIALISSQMSVVADAIRYATEPPDDDREQCVWTSAGWIGP